ncbi:rhodanese-like domain-containing protein [Acinetobacter sp. XS-4]|uniref:rhodanese-like domain-containing protein n=1 Tax=Acinetobacter sp. XS-4 TaxID=2923375 RepID=UPI00208FAA5E|nr:rhodanese-like domain-containing protein [Acinetobacter sp. XS-4]USP42027.1 rhodanese-related sulfurtransferase [Acinetobacter sp. XS-4]
MTTNIQTYQDIRKKLLAGQEIALIDVREEDPFAQGHPLFAVNISLSKLEVEILNRVPRLNTDIVLYDNGEGLAERAYQQLQTLGYQQVSLLDDGLQGWKDAGGEIFIDVNSASKAFGEFVEHHKGTPSLSAQEVKQLIDDQANIIILDARRFDEYQTMSIPNGISVPGAELALRAKNIVKDENTKIIVNCAGRTRSLIGTQSLINAKIGHEVYALRNGTIGWTLAQQQLALGQQQQYTNFPEKNEVGQVLKNAKELAERSGVKTIGSEQLQQLQQQDDRTTYIFDVRSEQEYIRAHLPDSRWIGGGQLVQETDHYASVRSARVVLVDDQLVRAYMTASWLAQMNWDVSVLDADFQTIFTQQGGWKPVVPLLHIKHRITPEQLQTWLDAREKVTILDFTSSANYQKGHIPTAQWLLKADIERLFNEKKIPTDHKIVVTCGTSLLAQYAVSAIQTKTSENVYVLEGGNQAWVKTFVLEADKHVYLSSRTDRYKRPYEGTDNSVQAMQDYLDWEYGLVAQLNTDGTHGFFVV